MFENGVLKRVFGLYGEEVKGTYGYFIKRGFVFLY
jgi:hypothetical protein